jgi:hypothetical protein
MRADSAADRWRRATDGPLLALALAFLLVFLLPLYRHTNESGEVTGSETPARRRRS